MIKTFYVIYTDGSGVEQTQEIEFDTTGYDEEDFLGGAGQEAVEAVWRSQCPDGEFNWLESAE